MSDSEQADQEFSPDQLIAFTVALEGALVLLAWGIGWWFEHDSWGSLSFAQDSWLPNLKAIGIGLLASLPTIGLVWLADRYRPTFLEPMHDALDQVAVPLFRHATIPELLLISVCAGLGEELFFRGLLQSGIAAWWGPPWGAGVGLAIASLTFGIVHWLNRQYALFAMLAGAYLGGLLLWTDNLLAPMTAHAAHDFGALLCLVWWKREAANSS